MLHESCYVCTAIQFTVVCSMYRYTVIFVTYAPPLPPSHLKLNSMLRLAISDTILMCFQYEYLRPPPILKQCSSG